MKKTGRLSILAIAGTIAFVIALCMSLVACGGTKGKDFIGTWTLSSMESDGMTLDMNDLTTYGITMTLTLNEDGSASYSDGSDTTKGTWKASSDTAAKITIDNASSDIKLDSGNLVMEDESGKLTFVKGEAAASSSSSTTSSSSSSATSSSSSATSSTTGTTGTTSSTTSTTSSSSVPMNYVVADDQYISFTVTAKEYDEFWGAGYVVTIINKSDKDLYVTAPYDTFSVNNVMDDATLGETILAGKQANTEFYFFDEVKSLDDLKGVEGTIEVWDDSTYETLASYPFKPAD